MDNFLNKFADVLPDFMKPFGDEMLRKYYNFEGKTDRKSFWICVLVTFAVNVVFSVGISIFGLIPYVGIVFRIFGGLILGVYNLAVLCPNIAITVRRLRDVGRPWYFLFWSVCPCVGTIVMIIVLAGESLIKVEDAGTTV